jgi:hypothetical protein
MLSGQRHGSTPSCALWALHGQRVGFGSRLKIGNGWNSMRSDLDGDGCPDLLAVESATGRLFLYLGGGTSFGAPRLIGSGWNAMSERTGVGDFNHVGRFDMFACNTATGDLWLYAGAATSLSPLSALVQGGTPCATSWLSAASTVTVQRPDRRRQPHRQAVQVSRARDGARVTSARRQRLGRPAPIALRGEVTGHPCEVATDRTAAATAGATLVSKTLGTM